jgi:hypothetical protein
MFLAVFLPVARQVRQDDVKGGFVPLRPSVAG